MAFVSHTYHTLGRWTDNVGPGGKEHTWTSGCKPVDTGMYSITLLDAAGTTAFPQTVPYSSVHGPKHLPFRVQGEFRTDGRITPGIHGIEFPVGIVYHVGNDDHAGHTGFKIVLSSGFSGASGYHLGFYVAQHTSYYRSAHSVQTGLDDGNWHSFEAIATTTYIQIIVDGVPGPIEVPSDERGVQAVKEFGRIETDVDYVLGQDPCCLQHGEQRLLSGEIRNVAVSWAPSQPASAIVQTSSLRASLPQTGELHITQCSRAPCVPACVR